MREAARCAAKQEEAREGFKPRRRDEQPDAPCDDAAPGGDDVLGDLTAALGDAFGDLLGVQPAEKTAAVSPAPSPARPRSAPGTKPIIKAAAAADAAAEPSPYDPAELAACQRAYSAAEKKLNDLRAASAPASQLKAVANEMRELKPRIRQLQAAAKLQHTASGPAGGGDAERGSGGSGGDDGPPSPPNCGSPASSVSAKRLERQRAREERRGGFLTSGIQVVD